MSSDKVVKMALAKKGDILSVSEEEKEKMLKIIDDFKEEIKNGKVTGLMLFSSGIDEQKDTVMRHSWGFTDWFQKNNVMWLFHVYIARSLKRIEDELFPD